MQMRTIVPFLLLSSVSSLTTSCLDCLSIGNTVFPPHTNSKSPRYTNSTTHIGSLQSVGVSVPSLRASGTPSGTVSSLLGTGSFISAGRSGSSVRASGTLRRTSTRHSPPGTNVSFSGSPRETSFISVSKILASETAPVITPIITTASGTTVALEIITGESLPSPITLRPASGTLLYPFDPQVTSSAFMFGKKLENVISEIEKFEDKKKHHHHHHDGIGPILGILKRTLHWGEGFLSKIKLPKSESSGCSASIFSLATCALKDLEDLSGKIKNNLDDIGPLLDDLGKLADQLEGDDNDEDQSSSAESSSTSSSTCSESTVKDLYVTCFPISTMSSRSFTCVSHTKTVSGCDLVATTTTTSSSSSLSSVAPSPLMTGWRDYLYPAFGPDHDKIVSDFLSKLRAENRLPMPLSSAGSIVSTSTRDGASSKSRLPTHSSNSTTVSKPSHRPTVTVTEMPSSLMSLISCVTSATTYTMTESGSSVLSPNTACSCNNGASGQLLTLNGPSAGSPTSYLGCFLGPSSTITMSTLSPPLPSAAIELVLNYNQTNNHKANSTWFVFGRHYTEPPEQAANATDVCDTNGTSAALDSWTSEIYGTISQRDLADRKFPFPEQSQNFFDFAGYVGCMYSLYGLESTTTGPGFVACTSPDVDRKPCVVDWTNITSCSQEYDQIFDQMVPKAWCPF